MIMPSYYTITFKSEKGEDFTTQTSLGCIRRGHPADTLQLYRQAATHLQQAIDAGNVDKGVVYQSVEFTAPGGQKTEYQVGELLQWTQEEQDGWICGTPEPTVDTSGKDEWLCDTDPTNEADKKKNPPRPRGGFYPK